MNIQLKARIESAINTVIEDAAEEDFWEGWIHDSLASQMANAAEAVFDSSMAGQKFAEEQGDR